MREVRLIARNTLRGIVRNKVVYLLLLLAVLVSIPYCSMMGMAGMAEEAGEVDAVRMIQVSGLSFLFGFWGFATQVLGVFLGATALSSEIRRRTIVPVLARPVERWAFLTGKWIGVQVFVLGFLAVGLAFGLFALWRSPLEPTPATWLGLGQVVVEVAVVTSSALFLGVFLPPALAGGIAILALYVGFFVPAGLDSPYWGTRLVSQAAWLVLPSRPPDDLLSESFRATALDLDTALHLRVAAENAGYAVVLLILACALFARREIWVKS